MNFFTAILISFLTVIIIEKALQYSSNRSSYSQVKMNNENFKMKKDYFDNPEEEKIFIEKKTTKQVTAKSKFKDFSS